MLFILVTQYVGPAMFAASEIQSYSETENSESNYIEGESEQSEEEVDSSVIQENSDNAIPDPQISQVPYPDYNVINFDAPAGYLVPEESTLYGAANGKSRVSDTEGTFHYIDASKGYYEMNSNAPGTMNPDTGEITYDSCGSRTDDKIRFTCEGYLIPMDTQIDTFNGLGGTYGTQESGINNSDTIVLYYPEALIVNGTKYDVKTKFDNFVKTSDSLVGSDGWFTTFAVSHYFYDGYWLNDFQSVEEEIQVFNSETGLPVNLADLKAYDFRFGIRSLNYSSSYETGYNQPTAEALLPTAGLDSSTALTTCDVAWEYNETFNQNAWQGNSGDECNGVSFNTTDTNTIKFRVVKNPSQADMYGNKYWEIAWFVPNFWATELPETFTDAGDAPATYGNGEIQTDGDVETEDEFYLGNVSPQVDGENDNYGHTNGLNDDNNPTSVPIYDDETTLDAYLNSDGSGSLLFAPTSDTLDLDVTYTDTQSKGGQIVVWIDFDANGSFDADEITSTSIDGSGSQTLNIVLPTDMGSTDTYMRIMMTDSTDDLTNKGNAAVYPGVGEVEDYPVTFAYEGDTEIVKSVVDDSNDGKLQPGETLTYTLEVTNPGTEDAHNVIVRDSMLESLPSWLTFNDDVVIDPTDIAHSGNLEDGDLTFPVIEAGQAVTITYSVTARWILPNNIDEVINVATDNGQDPIDPDNKLPIICPEDSVDCDDAIIPLDPTLPEIGGGKDVETSEVTSEEPSEVTSEESSEVTSEEPSEDNTIAITGSKGTLILIDSFLILGVALLLKNRMKNN